MIQKLGQALVETFPQYFRLEYPLPDAPVFASKRSNGWVWGLDAMLGACFDIADDKGWHIRFDKFGNGHRAWVFLADDSNVLLGEMQSEDRALAVALALLDAVKTEATK